MPEYHSINTKLSNFQLDKLKSVVENGTYLILKRSSSIVLIKIVFLTFHYRLIDKSQVFARLYQIIPRRT